MNSGIIFNIQRFCLHDGDGIRTCVFLKGCPLRCIWCHNPESLEKTFSLLFDKGKCSLCGRCLDVCSARRIRNDSLIIDRDNCMSCGKCLNVCLNGANEIVGKNMTALEVFDEVIKDKIFYDTSDGGLTVTGGEPSFQSEFTLELLSLAKKAGISIAVETCGIGLREFYEKAADLGTTFLFDLKCINSVRHKELTGSDNLKIIKNLQYLMERKADIIIRIPLVPECNDSDNDIELLAGFLNENKGRFSYAEIMPYHSLGVNKCEKIGVKSLFEHKSATDEDISRWYSSFVSHGADVRISK